MANICCFISSEIVGVRERITGSRDRTTNQRVTIFPVECNYVIPAIEGAEKTLSAALLGSPVK